ncbi:MAG: helix-turn-helix domain-containing protein [Chromatiales bacterium]|nr:helix-turn-helix domain-containing protein [Chromatiales bacterium]
MSSKTAAATSLRIWASTRPTRLYTRAALGAQVVKILQEEGYTQAEAAKRLGIQQPEVSALMCARFHPFQPRAADRLFEQVEFESDHSNQPPSERGTVATGRYRAMSGAN